MSLHVKAYYDMDDEDYDNQSYRFKNSYIFLKNYIKDKFPMTVDHNGDLICKSSKNRTYHDLIFMAQSHSENFSVERFNKDLKFLLYKGYINVLWCGNICNYVFTDNIYGFTGMGLHLFDHNNRFTGPDPSHLEYIDKNSPRHIYYKQLFIDTLGFKV